MIKARWIVGAVVVGLIGMHVGPLLLTHSEQDSCSFGNVSNDEYRLLLSKARIGFWRPFVWSDDIASVQLNTKYRELVPSSTTVDAKVAAAHAVLRALGAVLLRFDDFHSSSRDAKIRRAFVYRYLLDINRLFYFAPIFRQMMVTVIIDDPFLPARNEITGNDPPIIVHFPNISEGFYRFDQNLDARECPPIPSK